MRETDFLNNVKPDGAMMFRTSLPLGSGVYWNFRAAADGQMGRIISLYRDWKISGDTEWLKKLWPQAKKAMAYAWTAWDTDKDGLMEGEQHNTYDIEFVGPNSMIGGFYIGALKAALEMAVALTDWPAARTYRVILDKALQNYDATLWNGEYYVQKYDKVMEKKYQYGEGCLSDQLLGQWLGMVSGVGRFLPQDRVRSALGAIYKYNFMPDFRNFSNAQRTYALGDEKGLILCSWPKGGRPPLPFPYSDEVWTGIEYQVASHMIYEGLVKEGLTIVKGARDRYDGRRRNPWNEVECGHHYARAMSSWGLLLALGGYSYSGTDLKMGFDPKISGDDFRTVWTAGSGWGTYAQKVSDGKTATLKIEVGSGDLSLREFFFTAPASSPKAKPKLVRGTLGGAETKASLRRDGSVVHVLWRVPIMVTPDAPLELEIEY
jgi:non-lysosomal glucosylceramidase